ncbi:MAG: photosynthetic complex putative assembly protein PuhB [Pseudomonadota bacterium]
MSNDDFNFEPIRGLPEMLPEDEHIIWQGAPRPLQLAREAWKLHWVMGYFVVLAVWRVGVSSTTYPLTEAMGHGVPFLMSGLLACLILFGMAYVQARSTVYTLTNKRACLRIGAALTMTLNLPYVLIGNAHLATRRNGTGTLAFETLGETRISYIMTWPHARPWQIARCQPAFRAIPDAAAVAKLFAEAAEARISTPQVARIDPDQGAPTPVAAE